MTGCVHNIERAIVYPEGMAGGGSALNGDTIKLVCPYREGERCEDILVEVAVREVDEHGAVDT